jgi:hypothetical protein
MFYCILTYFIFQMTGLGMTLEKFCHWQYFILCCRFVVRTIINNACKTVKLHVQEK